MSLKDHPGFLPASLFVGLFLFNACFVSPFIGWYDSGEMTAVTSCLGISHPSGQPLYHLLGRIFSFFPFWTPAFRLGLLSAACGALASTLFYLLAVRLADVGIRKGPKSRTPSADRRLWVLLLTLAWSFSLPWGRVATLVEVYALHLVLAAGILWALGLEGRRRWPLVFFLLGLSTVFRPTHHLALPLVALALLFEGRKTGMFHPRDLFLWIAVFGLGRSSALYLPLRSALEPAVAHSLLGGPWELLRHVLALGYSKGLGAASWDSIAGTLGRMGNSIFRDLTPLGAGLAGLGIWGLFRKKERIPSFLWVALGWGALEAFLVLSIPYPSFESHQMLLGWLALGLLAARGLSWAGDWSGKDRGRSLSVGILLAALVGVQILSVGKLWEHRNERGAEDYARNVLEVLAPGAFFLPVEENEYFPVVGYQQSMDFRKDVWIFRPGTPLEELGPAVRDHLLAGGTAYLTRKWEGLPRGWGYQPIGPLWKIPPDPVRFAPRPPEGRSVQWEAVGLGPVRVEPSRVRQGGRIRMTYPWFRTGPGIADGTRTVVSLFMGPDGALPLRDGLLWLHDIRENPLGPFSGLPSDRSRLEERVLFIPSDFPPGRYRLVVGLQRQAPARTDGKFREGEGFYERGGTQALAKFAGRGGTREWVQFALLAQDRDGGEFLSVTASPRDLPDPRFAVAAEFEILPAE